MNPIPVAWLVTWGALRAQTQSPEPAARDFVATTPPTAVTRIAEAYTERSLSGLNSLLSADFRFHFSEGDSAGIAYAQGFSRANELNAARAMFFGVPGDTMRARPDRIAVNSGPIEEGVDPEHPDSTRQYRLAIAHDFQLRMVFLSDSTEVISRNAIQIFHVVRGDAAVRMPGQAADTTHWYVRRWLEDLDAVTISLGKVDGECGGGPAENEPLSAVPALVGLRAIGVPLCPTLKVLCDLPGSEAALLEVYDIQGRRLAERTVTPQSPGSVLAEAGGGQHVKPGAYWVRLVQGRRPPVTRMVMVAR